MTTITLQLDGLHCGNCVKSVDKALRELPTVSDVKIDLSTQIATIESEEQAKTLIDAIVDIGFEAKEA
ncbi:heavy metal-associated domain-containing protein [Glaesserella parasuis]|nr:heavy metal-associated domain-containing protein [Glaesserella parasuis]